MPISTNAVKRMDLGVTKLLEKVPMVNQLKLVLDHLEIIQQNIFFVNTTGILWPGEEGDRLMNQRF